MATPNGITLLTFLGVCFCWVHVSLGFQGESNTTSLKASGFEGPSLSPFSPCNVLSPSFVEANSGSSVYSGSAKAEAFFNEDYYDGTRNRKGAEFCFFEYGTSTNQIFFQKEGWQGFALYVPSDGYPTTKHSIIAQQFCPGGCSSWCSTLSIAENSLVVNYRPSCGDSTETTIVDSITRDEWHTIIVNIRLSNEDAGHYIVWYDGALAYNATGISIGFGDSWSNDILSPGAYFKNGIYASGMLVG